MVSGFEFDDFVECEFPSELPGPAGGQSKTWTVVSASQLRWQQQDFVAQALQRCGLIPGWWGELLEPVHQVVGQQQQMKVGVVGHEVASGAAPTGVVGREPEEGSVYGS